jgi:hypothetical protein
MWPIIAVAALLIGVTLGGVTGRIVLWLQTTYFRS